MSDRVQGLAGGQTDPAQAHQSEVAQARNIDSGFAARFDADGKPIGSSSGWGGGAPSGPTRSIGGWAANSGPGDRVMWVLFAIVSAIVLIVANRPHTNHVRPTIQFLPPGVPAVKEILAKTRVQDPIETLARQCAALNGVIWFLRSQTGGSDEPIMFNDRFGRWTQREHDALVPYWLEENTLTDKARNLLVKRAISRKMDPSHISAEWDLMLSRNKGLASRLWPAVK